MKKALLTFMATGLFCLNTMAVYRNLELPANLENKVKGVRLTDFAKHTSVFSNLLPSAQKLEKDWNKFVPETAALDKALNIFLHDVPKVTDSGVLFPITAFGQLKRGSSVQFIQAEAIRLEGGGWSVSVINTVPLTETLFDLNVSLIERKLVMRDNLSEMMMVFPLGVGSFDEGVLNNEVTLLTPRYKNSFLDQWAAISERKKPRYFAGKPFLRITTNENPANGHTPIGFHVQPNLDTFVRAFDSHGCMRMQLKDLNMLHDLLKKGPHRRLSINVKFQIEDNADHPFKKRNKPYKRVLNSGNKSLPDYVLDRDGLVQTQKDWERSAPIDQLVDRTGDHAQEMFNYDTDWREKAKREEQKESCLAQFPYSEAETRRETRKLEKKYNKCMEAGQSRTSLSDRVYKWWVH
jgi:hypothetical protein